MPSVATTGTIGVLNERSNPGSLIRITHTPAQTSTNANKVPIDVMSPTMSPGMKPAKSPQMTINTRFALYGVRKFGCKSEKNLGTNPSTAIKPLV